MDELTSKLDGVAREEILGDYSGIITQFQGLY